MRFSDYQLWFKQKSKTYTSRYFNRANLDKALFDYRESFQFSTIGVSTEGREIEEIKIGSGSNHVLVWSQMHGNEPTGTMAILDLLQFFDNHPNWFNQHLANLTLHLIPLLNPDGAAQFKRRTSLGIDPNRDAVRLVTPEVKCLFKQIDLIKPIFCFNLHDQRTLFSVGDTANPATLSFLIPSFDQSKNMDRNRAKGMNLVGQIVNALPGGFKKLIGKYTDEFYPTATGDNIQKLGINCLLLESGGYFKDPLKRQARLLNGYALLKAWQELNTWNQVKDDPAVYHAIPFNGKKMKDVLIREASIRNGKHSFLADIALKRHEVLIEENLSIFYSVEDIGDLSAYYGYIEFEKLSFIKNDWEVTLNNSKMPLDELQQKYPQLY